MKNSKVHEFKSGESKFRIIHRVDDEEREQIIFEKATSDGMGD